MDQLIRATLVDETVAHAFSTVAFMLAHPFCLATPNWSNEQSPPTGVRCLLDPRSLKTMRVTVQVLGCVS